MRPANNNDSLEYWSVYADYLQQDPNQVVRVQAEIIAVEIRLVQIPTIENADAVNTTFDKQRRVLGYNYEFASQYRDWITTEYFKIARTNMFNLLAR